MKKDLYSIITLGAAWGIFEATVGYLLHLLGLRIGGMIWFPVAYFFIHSTYRYTNRISSVMLTAMIASSLKLINLFFPGRIDMVINPAISIILEAFSVMLVCRYLTNRQMSTATPFTILLSGFTWRTLYICYILCMPQSLIDLSSFTAMPSFLKFMFLNNVINTCIISAGLFGAKALQKPFQAISCRLKSVTPSLAALTITLAVMIQVILR